MVKFKLLDYVIENYNILKRSRENFSDVWFLFIVRESARFAHFQSFLNDPEMEPAVI